MSGITVFSEDDVFIHTEIVLYRFLNILFVPLDHICILNFYRFIIKLHLVDP